MHIFGKEVAWRFDWLTDLSVRKPDLWKQIKDAFYSISGIKYVFDMRKDKIPVTLFDIYTLGILLPVRSLMDWSGKVHDRNPVLMGLVYFAFYASLGVRFVLGFVLTFLASLTIIPALYLYNLYQLDFLTRNPNGKPVWKPGNSYALRKTHEIALEGPFMLYLSNDKKYLVLQSKKRAKHPGSIPLSPWIKFEWNRENIGAVKDYLLLLEMRGFIEIDTFRWRGGLRSVRELIERTPGYLDETVAMYKLISESPGNPRVPDPVLNLLQNFLAVCPAAESEFEHSSDASERSASPSPTP